MTTLSNDWKQSLEQATAEYQTHLDLAVSYLENRGIATTTAVSLRLGVCANPMPGHDQYRNRLAIPYLTRNGVVQIKFRTMTDQDPKYLGLTGTRPHLYNVEALFDADSYIAITEGELDAAVLSSQVGVPAVGCPGVSVWQDHFPRLFAGYDVVYVFADGDEPGREFSQRVRSDLPQAVIIRCPDGMDVSNLYMTEGADALRERMGL